MSQRNMRLHFLVALAVIFLSFLFPLTKIEVLFIFIVIFFVLFAELLNTVVEKIVDLITKDYNFLAKIIKDMSAGVVLLSSLLAVVVGTSIFYPYVRSLFKSKVVLKFEFLFLALIIFDFFLTLLVKVFLYNLKLKEYEPSILFSLLFCIGNILVFVFRNLFFSLLLYFLLLLFILLRLKLSKKKEKKKAFFTGAFLGSLVSLISFLF